MRKLGRISKLLAVAALALAPLASFAGVFISVGFAPPALPIYAQPICPGDGFLWNPGYWGYGPGGYYWVPGVWVQPPTVGYLWTPGYWGWGGSAFLFHEGYWGQHVGFYGGINYGFGYGGSGFYGGEWRGGHFAYNTAYSHVNGAVIHNTYVNNSVHVNVNVNSHTSFNGGQGGIQAHASGAEMQAEHENHVQPTGAQQSHMQQASSNRANFASANGGHPQVAAMARPGAMNTAVPARGAVVGQRANNQQQRIANGVGSGQMTARETANTENREANINRTVRNDRQANGGTMTPQERSNVNQRQNNVSRSINQDKHNAAVQPQARQQAAPQAHPQAAPHAEAAHAEGGEHKH